MSELLYFKAFPILLKATARLIILLECFLCSVWSKISIWTDFFFQVESNDTMTVVRLSRLTEELSGVYTCKVSTNTHESRARARLTVLSEYWGCSCTRRSILRLQDISLVLRPSFCPSQWLSRKMARKLSQGSQVRFPKMWKTLCQRAVPGYDTPIILV